MPRVVKEKYDLHNIETRKMYDEVGVPRYLIAYGTDKCVLELLTKSKITVKNSAALGIRSVSKEEAVDYYTMSTYNSKICNFFDIAENIDENLFDFSDYYNFEGYIEGKINKQDEKGNFKGKIKIKE